MPERVTSSEQVSLLLDQLEAGSPSAASELLPLVYDQLRGIAASFLRRERPDHTLQPTALVHEAYVNLVGQTRVEWKGRAHFLAIAGQAMRRILVNHAYEKKALKRGGGWHRVTLTAVETPSTPRDVDLIALDDALTQLETLDSRQCRVIELRFFGGLTVEEAAAVLGIAPRTVELDWRMARSWLFNELSK